MKNKIEVIARRPGNMTGDIEKFRFVRKFHFWDKDTYKEEPLQENKDPALVMICSHKF